MQEFSELATRIEAALADDSAALESVSAEIEKAMAWHVQRASAPVSDVVHGQASAHPDLRTAYALGHLSFAHLLVEQTASRLASSAFYEAFDDPKYSWIVNALARAEMTNTALADDAQVRVETVSRSLRALRELGITAFRKIGTQVFNYLTPAALAFRDGLDTNLVIPRQTRITLDEKIKELPAHLREQSILSD
jgi:DNA-binding transcriptional ArsR family regulator